MSHLWGTQRDPNVPKLQPSNWLISSGGFHFLVCTWHDVIEQIVTFSLIFCATIKQHWRSLPPCFPQLSAPVLISAESQLQARSRVRVRFHTDIMDKTPCFEAELDVLTTKRLWGRAPATGNRVTCVLTYWDCLPLPWGITMSCVRPCALVEAKKKKKKPAHFATYLISATSANQFLLVWRCEATHRPPAGVLQLQVGVGGRWMSEAGLLTPTARFVKHHKSIHFKRAFKACALPDHLNVPRHALTHTAA